MACSPVCNSPSRAGVLTRHRYMCQILYGCHNPFCTTPTCLSCKKRLKSVPLRIPTQLTARALANFLASQDNPITGLCPHDPRMSASALAFDSEVSESAMKIGSPESQATPLSASINGQTLIGPAKLPVQGPSNQAQVRLSEAINARRQSKKDPKALGQNVHNTSAMIVFYSRHFSSPLDIFHKLARAARPPDAASSGAGNNRIHSFCQQSYDPTLNTNAEHAPSAPSSARSRFEDLEDASSSVKPVASQIDSSLGGPEKASDPEDVMNRNTCPPMRADGAGTDIPVASELSCDLMDEMVKYTEEEWSRTSLFSDPDKRLRLHGSAHFVRRSLFYTLSNPHVLLASFRDLQWEEGLDSPLAHLIPGRLSRAFQHWTARDRTLIFDSLWIAVEALFTPPPELDCQKRPRLRAGPRSPSASSNDRGLGYLSDFDAAHIIMVSIHALAAAVSLWQP